MSQLLRVGLHRAQMQMHRSPARFKVGVCGRRFGKTEWAMKELFLAALTVIGLYWWVAPLYKELGPATRTFQTVFHPDMVCRKLYNGPVLRYVQLWNMTEIEFHSADKEDSLRGSGLTGLVIDETDTLKPKRWEEELAPSLMDKSGWAIFIGTPKGRRLLYVLYHRGQKRDEWPDWESWRFTSWDNAHSRGGFIRDKEIENIKKALPELTYRQEVMAEFLEGEGIVFRYVDDAVDKARRHKWTLGPPEEGCWYVVGADLAKHQDWTVLTAVDQFGRLRGFERFNQIDWPFIKARVQSFSIRYNNAPVYLDATGVGDPIYDDLVRMGVPVVPYKISQPTKAALVEKLSIYLDQQHLSIPPELIETLVEELKAFEYELTPAGNVTYGAPEGQHDDCVISLGLAVWGLSFSRQPNISMETVTR